MNSRHRITGSGTPGHGFGPASETQMEKQKHPQKIAGKCDHFNAKTFTVSVLVGANVPS